MQDIKAAAVVVYRKVLITQEMRYHRVSQWGKRHDEKRCLYQIVGEVVIIHDIIDGRRNIRETMRQRVLI